MRSIAAQHRPEQTTPSRRGKQPPCQATTEDAVRPSEGLAVLAGTKVWERFSFFGMQALLMLHMTKYLLLPENARGVLALAQFCGVLTATFGPMADLAFATQTYGIYSGPNGSVGLSV